MHWVVVVLANTAKDLIEANESVVLICLNQTYTIDLKSHSNTYKVEKKKKKENVNK